MTFGDEFPLESDIVFDDSVVYYDNLAPAVHMGVGVGVRRAAMCRPSSVAYSGEAVGHRTIEGRGKVLQLAGLLVHLRESVRAHHGDPGAVISPIRK